MPLGNTSNSRSGRLFAAVESTYGTAVALSGSNCMRHISAKLRPMNPRQEREDKTGTLSSTKGNGGLRFAEFEMMANVAANGAAGTAPDCDPILQSFFGVAPTIVSSTSVTYNLSDGTKSLTIGHYRTPSTVQQQLGGGIVITQLDFGFNDGVNSKFKASGRGKWVVDSKTYSTLDTEGKMGVGSAPSEPSTPVTNGDTACAFRGSITVNGTAVLGLKKASISAQRPANPQYSYGSAYPQGMGLAKRKITIALDLFDSDDAYMLDILQHGIQDTVFGVVLVNGNVAGNIWTHTISGIQISPPGLNDSEDDRWIASFDPAGGSASTTAATDEYILAIT